jgi:hypothetical protein
MLRLATSTGSGWYRLKATNTSCAVARKLADHFVLFGA